LVCAWLALASSASAAPTWLPPTDIAGPTASITFPEVAVNSAGDAAAIWIRKPVGGGDTVVEALERPAGGEWAVSGTLSESGEEILPLQTPVQIGLDDAGNAIAIWEPFNDVIRTAERPAGGEWSDPEDLFTEGGQLPQLAMNAAGDAVIVWERPVAGGDAVVQAAERPAGGDWLEPDDLSVAGEDAGSPRVAIDAAGTAIAVWQLSDPGENEIRAAVRPMGEEWSAPDDLSEVGDNAQSPRVAMNDAGDAVAAWTVIGGGIQAAIRPALGGWSLPEDVSATEEGTPALAIDSGRNAFALWSGPGSTDRVLRTSMRPPGGEWSEADELSAEYEGFRSYDLTASPAAGVFATWTWSQGIPEENGIEAAVRPPGSDWSAPEEISTEGENSGLPDLGFDADGNAIAIWGREKGEHEYSLQGAGYDFSGPQLNGLQIPATGMVGEPVSFAVSPFDVFSLGATSWTFGDGSPAAGGNAVSHVYAAPGTYPVTVSALDGSGNVSTQTAGIAIAAKPTPPPPPPPGKIKLSLRLESTSLKRLLRSGGLTVFTTVSEPAGLTLRGQARVRLGGAKGPSVKLVTVFKAKTVKLTAAGERGVALRLSKRGRELLHGLTKVKVLISGTATNAGAETASRTRSQALRR